MTAHTRTALLATIAVVLAALFTVLGPGESGAAERRILCDSADGQLGCLCPDGSVVTLGPVFDADGPVVYDPDQIAEACGDGTTTTTTVPATTTTEVPTTTTVPPVQVAPAIETAPAVPAPAAAVAGATVNRAPRTAGAAISFTG